MKTLQLYLKCLVKMSRHGSDGEAARVARYARARASGIALAILTEVAGGALLLACEQVAFAPGEAGARRPAAQRASNEKAPSAHGCVALKPPKSVSQRGGFQFPSALVFRVVESHFGRQG